MSTPPPSYQTQQPAPGVPPQQGFQAPPAAPKGGRTGKRFGKRLLVYVVGIAVVGIGGYIYDHATGAADTAKAGDCVQNQGTDASPDVHVISCSDPNAKFKVLKVLDNTSDDTACKALPNAVESFTETGDTNLVLCLGNNG